MRQKLPSDDQRKREPAPPLAFDSDCRVPNVIVPVTCVDAPSHRQVGRE